MIIIIDIINKLKKAIILKKVFQKSTKAFYTFLALIHEVTCWLNCCQKDLKNSYQNLENDSGNDFHSNFFKN
jgi:hypothetical protein